MANAHSIRLSGAVLRPTALAFIVLYFTATFPKIGAVVLSLLRKNSDFAKARYQIAAILRKGFDRNRLPTFAAFTIGSSLTLQVPLNYVFQNLDAKVHGGTSAKRTRNNRVAAKFVAALFSALIGFGMLNQQSPSTLSRITLRDRSDSNLSMDSDVDVGPSRPPKPSRIPSSIPPLPAKAITARQPAVAYGVPLAGTTIDLTLFGAVRAADILAQWYYDARAPKSKMTRWWSTRASPALFVLSSAIIMNAFFYAPSRLPYTYVKWIDRLAELDERLLHALRQAKYGNFIYGKETGIGELLGSMARDYNLPEEWGNPAKTIPVPCELVHHGCGKSCEKHALWRFWRSWRLAMGVYAPLQTVVLMRGLQKARGDWLARSEALKKVLTSTIRSSAFLGSFVALFYYGVCLTRTRLGPALIPRNIVTAQMYDSGLCVLGGCVLCGWSVLCELPRRQAELMLFVLPRALGVWFPRRYLRENIGRERAAFAISTAIMLTAAQERPDWVRGVFGRALGTIMNS